MNSGYLLLSVSSLWILSELCLLIFQRTKEKGSSRDEGSIVWLNVTIYVSVTIAVTCGMMGIGRIHLVGTTLPWIGLFFILAGLVLRWTAILTLRRFFTTNVAIQSGQKLIQAGIYKYLRHPSYTGTLISFIGLAIAMSNWVTALVLLIPITFVFIRRIRIEERVLSDTFGEEYARYHKSTRALLPWIY